MAYAGMERLADVSEPHWYETVSAGETVAAGGRINSIFDDMGTPVSPEHVVLFRRAVLILALLSRYDEVTELCIDLEYYADGIVQDADHAARGVTAREWLAKAAVVENSLRDCMPVLDDEGQAHLGASVLRLALSSDRVSAATGEERIETIKRRPPRGRL